MKQRGYKLLFLVLFFSFLFFSGFAYVHMRQNSTIYVNTEPDPLDFAMDIYISPEMADELLKGRPFWMTDLKINEQTLHNLTLTATAYSWEDLQTMHWRESQPLENFGNSTVQIINSSIKHHLISLEEPSPFMGTDDPYTIEWNITNTTLEPGEMTDFWIYMTFRALCNFEFTEMSVDYIYEEKEYTATLNIGTWLVNVVMNSKPA